MLGDNAADADEVRAVSLQADGKILAAGLSQRTSNNDDIAVARYEEDGDLDPNFDGAPNGSNGRGFYEVNTPGSSDESVNGMAILSNGNVFLGGTAAELRRTRGVQGGRDRADHLDQRRSERGLDDHRQLTDPLLYHGRRRAGDDHVRVHV